jgi:hypothetical protein
MKTKNFLISGIAGGIASFFLGWIIYGILFKDSFPQPTEGSNTMIMIALGSLTFGLFLSFIFLKWAHISTLFTGAKAGAIIGIFLGFYFNFFNMAMSTDATFQMFALDIVLTAVLSSLTGAIIGLVNNKLG